jgi:hypothetical protein
VKNMGLVWEDSELVIPNKIEGQCVLACPICKWHDLHILEVDVHRGNDKISITNKNVSIDELKNDSRGVIIEIEYEGECGHSGIIRLHFYKGQIYVSHKRLPDICGAAFPGEERILHYKEKGDIFRD